MRHNEAKGRANEKGRPGSRPLLRFVRRGSVGIVHVELDRMRGHLEALDLARLELDIAVDEVVREHVAGLDGIKNKIDPGPAVDKDLYDLPPKELKKIPTVCGSLREALGNLDKDRAFLKNGGVFDDDFIDAYIELKMTEVARFEMTPHPVEFEMYYSL